jgi:hypothetical protein
MRTRAHDAKSKHCARAFGACSLHWDSAVAPGHLWAARRIAALAHSAHSAQGVGKQRRMEPSYYARHAESPTLMS